MTTVPIIELRDAIKVALDGATGKTWEPKYAPYFEPTELTQMRYMIGMSSEDSGTKRRGMEDGELEIILGFQQVLPGVESREDDYIENAEWLDARMGEVEAVKALFRPGGALRDVVLADKFEFRTMKNSPVYNPVVLLEEGIFQTAVQLTFVTEYEG